MIKLFKNSVLTVLLFTLATNVLSQKLQNFTTLQVPGKDSFCKINPTGVSILPSGRFVQPAGSLVRITNDPFGMAIAPNGQKAVTLHNGVFTIIDLVTMEALRVPDYAGKTNSPLAHSPITDSILFSDSLISINAKSPLSKGSFLGVAFAPDSKTIYLSGGDNGAVLIFDIEKMLRIDSISLNGKIDNKYFDDSFTSDLLLYDNELLILDRGNFRMVRYDIVAKKIIASIPAGRQPFGLAISPDKNTAFVANVGMYAYPLITGMDSSNYNEMMISHHPYGNNTKASREGTTIDGKKIPGLGSPNAPEAMSVFSIDLKKNKVSHIYKTGYQVGEMVEGVEVVGGASPNSIAVGKSYAYVSNATNDNIAVIDYRLQKIIAHIPIKVDKELDKYRGLLPFGLTLSKDETKLYVALLGFNAIAVIDLNSNRTIGLIPTGWGPTRVKLSNNDSEIYIVSCRGLGAGPNGGQGFIAPPQGTYIGDIQLGSFQKLKMPTAKQLTSFTQVVINNTYTKINIEQPLANPLPVLPGVSKSPIKYIVYITKENRTYDEVFGQLENANGDSSLARFGVDCEYVLPDSLKPHFPQLKITPNHHKAAKQFAFSDNFYCDSDASIHGHHWMMGVIPNEWVEANSSVDKTAAYFSKAPGRRFPGSTGSIDPEDYAERGGLWEALERKKLNFYNFGEANETAHVREEWNDTATGAAHAVMVPMQKALFTRTSREYAGYNTNIPDQFRMKQFENVFTNKWIKGKEKMPSLITVQIPNDHTAGPRPEDGYFSRSSYVADNDLAVGRILHFLSRTAYWKNMLVIITEDDPQGGVDHIDAHRSILMMAGPYVKKHYISHTHANFGSILKVIYNILNVPYVNQYDATASLLQDFFTNQPDFTPYSLEKHDTRVFDIDKAMKKYHQSIDWRKIIQGPAMDNPTDMKKSFLQ